MWQDWIFGPGTIVLVAFLSPMLFDCAKPPLPTAVGTAMVLLSFAVAHATLGFWLAAGTSGIAGLQWGVLGYQRWRHVLRIADEEE